MGFSGRVVKQVQEPRWLSIAATQRLFFFFFFFKYRPKPFSSHPQSQMVSVDRSHSGASIKTTLVQVLSGLERNPSTLMQSLYQFITRHCTPPRLPSPASLLVNIKSCIIYYLRSGGWGELMNILEEEGKKWHPLSSLEPIIKIC